MSRSPEGVWACVDLIFSEGENDMFKLHNVLGFCLTLALFASGAEAELLNSLTLCEAIGGTGQDARFCLPSEPVFFPEDIFVVSDDADSFFTISGEETAVILTMNSGVTGNDLDVTGFRLIGLQSDPPIIAPIGPGDLDFLGNWDSFPTSLPVVTNLGGTPPDTLGVGDHPGNTALIR
jgi:hypothetical protein